MKSDKSSLETLSHEYHEGWFLRGELKIRQKGAWFATEHTVEKYAWIARHEDALEGDLASSFIEEKDDTNIGRSNNIKELTSRLARQGGSWNVEKRKEFDQWDANAQEIMTDGLDADDAALIDGFVTAATVWTQFKI